MIFLLIQLYHSFLPRTVCRTICMIHTNRPTNNIKSVETHNFKEMFRNFLFFLFHDVTTLISSLSSLQTITFMLTMLNFFLLPAWFHGLSDHLMFLLCSTAGSFCMVLSRFLNQYTFIRSFVRSIHFIHSFSPSNLDSSILTRTLYAIKWSGWLLIFYS